MNLSVNAGHAMREKGGLLEINLSSMVVDADLVAKNPDSQPGPYLKLTVADTGHGMDQAVRHRIFEPYFTTKDPGEGTGLGLAMVYGIVKDCGGWINVWSELGKGSAFEVFLPRIEGAAPPENMFRMANYAGCGRVLLVDDEEAIVQVEKEMLEKFGFDVVATINSHEALETFRNQPERFDLVITDLTMPGMTGLELAQELLRMNPDLPIILSTGFSEMNVREKAMECGIRGFISKPIRMVELADLIQNVLAQKPESRRLSRIPARSKCRNEEVREWSLGCAELVYTQSTAEPNQGREK